ncbi:unnamed protein product (macronuclear) [Paramecium tetraurelia]|uniref:Uncharacterized protein n=1 Tax=Paramecium tetraurelia TaxID=5888 RepID=A0DF25_PARTE|nr:uncharacterized protein GSPATT00016469001 [Paramecium tetraurelia]CAK81642.1 unnamed protein product [Paramecium tetraurelia]|eukprot:XP_001449039.1 hypothetical protein (macronuclear) [Paramecium tetraurelia strain d4-2]
MSLKYQLNELHAYRYSYYKDNNPKIQVSFQSKNAKLKKELGYNINIKHLPSTAENQENDDLKKSINQLPSSIDSLKSNILRRKTQIDWLYSKKVDQENILMLNRVFVQNLFSQAQLIEFDDNQLLFEIEETQKQQLTNSRLIVFKFLIQKCFQRLKLLQLDVLIQCSKCKQILQAATNIIKKTKSLAIFISHCNQNIRIDFFHNNDQFPKNQENYTSHVAFVSRSQEKVVIIRAKCAVICKCENENDSILTLENPLQLKDGIYTLLANEPYRKLCRYCCREVILQQCELMILP